MIDPMPFDALWFRILVGIVVGMILGSFTTMLAYRLPRKISIVQPPSTCPSCQTRLGVRDLVPIFSWAISNGKCRHCGSKIGARYLWIELAVTVLTIVVFVGIGLNWLALLTLIVTIIVVTRAIIWFESKL